MIMEWDESDLWWRWWWTTGSLVTALRTLGREDAADALLAGCSLYRFTSNHNCHRHHHNHHNHHYCHHHHHHNNHRTTWMQCVSHLNHSYYGNGNVSNKKDIINIIKTCSLSESQLLQLAGRTSKGRRLCLRPPCPVQPIHPSSCFDVVNYLCKLVLLHLCPFIFLRFRINMKVK